MSARNTAASDEVTRSVSRAQRDYRLSFAILVAGIVEFVGILAFAYLGNLTGNYPASGTGPVGLMIVVIESTGFAMMFVGSLFASQYRSLLHQRPHTAQPGPPG
jgi:hypothetical protein